jgi:hypothetical protein
MCERGKKIKPQFILNQQIEDNPIELPQVTKQHALNHKEHVGMKCELYCMR